MLPIHNYLFEHICTYSTYLDSLSSSHDLRMHHAVMITHPFNILQAVTLNFLLQAVIDANIFPVLIEILGKAEFKTRKEAAWAITNATSGGTAEQIRYLVDQGCIPPLCDLLTVMDGKIVQVALNGLENILRLGDQDAKAHKGVNPYAVLIEECYGELKTHVQIYW